MTAPVRVLYHSEPDGWWADSPDLPGWSAAGRTYREARELVEGGVVFVLGAAHPPIEHHLESDPVMIDAPRRGSRSA